jgi:hypothetical protein
MTSRYVSLLMTTVHGVKIQNSNWNFTAKTTSNLESGTSTGKPHFTGYVSSRRPEERCRKALQYLPALSQNPKSLLWELKFRSWKSVGNLESTGSVYPAPHPGDAGCKVPRNFGMQQKLYTASQSGRPCLWSSPAWEPQISRHNTLRRGCISVSIYSI